MKCDKYFEYFRAEEASNPYKEDKNEKFKEILYKLGESVDEENGLNELEAMMPYYNQVESVASEITKKYLPGEVHDRRNPYGQRLFEKEYGENKYFCYTDIVAETENDLNILEVKATSSRKFMDMKYNKIPIFEKGDDNVIRLRETSNPDLLQDKKYMKQREKLLDSGDKVGKYFYDLAYQYFIINGTPDKRTNYYLAVLNHEYVFDGEYSDDRNPIYSQNEDGNELITFIDISPLLNDYEKKIEEDIEYLEGLMETEEFDKPYLDGRCSGCDYESHCWKDIPEKNSILSYIGSHYGFEDDSGTKRQQYDLLNEGYINLLDIPDSWLKRENNIIQRNVVETGEAYTNREKIKDALETLKYPLYHLDFETFPCPLPRFRGEKPYSQSVFQFSLHIEKEPGVCHKEKDHYEFLADSHSDIRENFIKTMLEHIDLEAGGNVIVYNQSFEKTRVKELAEIFPKYKVDLEKLNEKIFDLLYIVKTNSNFYKGLGYSDPEAKLFNYYHEDLDSSFSIKKVLPVFSPLSYEGLAVYDGVQAMLTYADENLLKAKQKELKEYCKQDTWAMVEILEELRKLADQNL